MKNLILLLALALTACASAPRGEVTIYVVAPLSGWQANGG